MTELMLRSEELQSTHAHVISTVKDVATEVTQSVDNQSASLDNRIKLMREQHDELSEHIQKLASQQTALGSEINRLVRIRSILDQANVQVREEIAALPPIIGPVSRKRSSKPEEQQQ